MSCVAVCCSVTHSKKRYHILTNTTIECVAVCCSVLQCVAVCCSVLQYDTFNKTLSYLDKYNNRMSTGVVIHIYLQTHRQTNPQTRRHTHTQKYDESLYSAKDTYNFKEPTNRSHPICVSPVILYVFVKYFSMYLSSNSVCICEVFLYVFVHTCRHVGTQTHTITITHACAHALAHAHVHT